jgi:hypothetical protein
MVKFVVNCLRLTVHSQLWLSIDLNLKFSVVVCRRTTRMMKKRLRKT